jgi:hypothetical protein
VLDDHKRPPAHLPPDAVIPERPEDLPFRPMARLFAAWRDWPKRNGLPARDCFDPTDHPTLLPHISLFDVEPGPPRRFRLRVVGTEVVRALNRDATGRYMDDLPGTEFLIAHLDWLCDNRRPYFRGDRPVTWVTERDHVFFDCLGLPFAEDGGAVNKILYMLLFR